VSVFGASRKTSMWIWAAGKSRALLIILKHAVTTLPCYHDATVLAPPVSLGRPVALVTNQGKSFARSAVLCLMFCGSRANRHRRWTDKVANVNVQVRSVPSLRQFTFDIYDETGQVKSTRKWVGRLFRSRGQGVSNLAVALGYSCLARPTRRSPRRFGSAGSIICAR
jgi:hypothetical protein